MDKQTYLETKIKPLMEDLVSQLAVERPEDPLRFIVSWIERSEGYRTSGLTPEEAKEMEKLKEEVKKFPHKNSE